MLCVQQKDWRMHQNMHFKTQKLKKKLGMGQCPLLRAPQWGGGHPIPLHTTPPLSILSPWPTEILVFLTVKMYPPFRNL